MASGRVTFIVPVSSQIVMENSMQTSGDIPDSVDFTQKFDFRFIDPGPEDIMSKNRRFFAYEVIYTILTQILYKTKFS
jgi:hypothetical protein